MEFPRYERGSWELEPVELDTATFADWEQWDERIVINIEWFLRDDRAGYTAEQVAELLGVAPRDVADIMAKSSGIGEAVDGTYERSLVFGAAIDGEHWTVPMIDAAAKRMAALAHEPQIAAIRRFFTDPKESYSREEAVGMLGLSTVEKIGDGLFDGRDREDRQTIGDFLRGYVAPVTIGSAVGDLIANLALWAAAVDTVAAHATRRTGRRSARAGIFTGSVPPCGKLDRFGD